MPRTGTGRVYQRGNAWWIDFSHRGQRQREPAGPKRKDATDLLKQRLGEIGGGTFVGRKADRVTFADLAEGLRNNYKLNGRRSLERAEYGIKHLESFFGADEKALDITSDRLEAYAVARKKEGAALATIQRELANLRRMFTLAVRAGRLKAIPAFPTLNISNARRGFLDGAELERVIAELPAAVRPVVHFAAWTGWRRGEILSRTWAHVDFERGTIRLEPGETKNDEGREFPFRALPALAALLQQQREHTRELERKTGTIVPQVFHRNGEPIQGFRRSWATACRKAGVPGAIFHDLRRTAVRNLERAGVSRSVAMSLTGHKTESVYRRYAITNAASQAEGVEKLARLHQQPAEPAKVVPLSRGA